MKLVHKKADTWTAEDGTLFLDQRAAERYVAHRQLTMTLMQRFAVPGPQEIMPPMTIESAAELILSLTFDAQPVVNAGPEFVGR